MNEREGFRGKTIPSNLREIMARIREGNPSPSQDEIEALLGPALGHSRAIGRVDGEYGTLPRNTGQAKYSSSSQDVK